jgi:hypothetical protein
VEELRAADLQQGARFVVAPAGHLVASVELCALFSTNFLCQ